MCMECEKRRADRDAVGPGCFDHHVLLAVDDLPGIVEVEQPARAPAGSAATALYPRSRQIRPGARMADDPRQQQGGRREWQVREAGQIAVVVEHRSSGRTFHAGKIEPGMDRKRGCSTHNEARERAAPARAAARAARAWSSRPASGRSRPFIQIGFMNVAVISMQTVDGQVGQLVDQRIELGRRLARLNAGSAHADIEID